MSDLKTSLLVNRQVPEFIREEYPLFITFLEAYYEYLETKQGTQLNDLIQKSKDLRYISDVDQSIDDFEINFFNTYASLLPKTSEVSKEFLIKNVLPLYLSKGNEKSFKLLFRLLFNDEVEIKFPNNNVLRASDGKWTVDNILRAEKNVRSVYTGDGSKTTYFLAQIVDYDEINVYVDGILKVGKVDYFLRKETQKIIFTSAPANNSKIEVYYNDFIVENLNNRKITGKISGATALIEKAVSRIITDRLTVGLPFEFFINDKTLKGSFISGELITTNVIAPDESLVNLEVDLFSVVTTIEVGFGGASYNVGDPVLITGGNFRQRAVAEVADVADGSPSRVLVVYGGAGFKISGNIFSIETTTVEGYVDAINSADANSRLSFDYNNDVIGNYASVLISSPDYGFPSTVIPAGENVNTRIADALSYLAVTDLAPISNAIIVIAGSSTSNSISLDANSPTFSINSTSFEIKSFESIGRIDINNGGSGYKVGDEIIFTNIPGTIGTGGAAAVKQVDGTGKITRVEIQPPRVAGTANVLNNAVQIVGTGTLFGTELQVGDKIVIRSQERYINAISSSTSANVNVAFSFSDGTIWANNSPIGSSVKGMTGGMNYDQNKLPLLSVSSAAGIGANVQAKAIMGDGEIIKAASDFVSGEILAIRVLSGGAGYEYIPLIDLTATGDGSATANAQISNSYITLPGRWLTSDSILSTTERKLQGANYYIDYSYVTSSSIAFSRYKDILKQLLHPAGFVNYSDLNKEMLVVTNTVVTFSSSSNTISGLVNVANGTIYVTGTNTKFNIANSKGILTIGSNVAVNGEIRTVNSIISNTNLSVSLAFTTNANSQSLIVLA